MAENRRWTLKNAVETVVWVGLIAFIGVRVWPQVGAALGVGGAGPQVADIAVETLEGDTIALADLRGQVVLVNFWATWCPPCRIEMPGFERVYAKYRDRGFTIVALSTDRGARGDVREFVAERELSFPIAMATSESMHAFGGGRALPMSFLVDREGRIRHTVRGLFAQPALDQAVARLLAEDASAE